MSVKGWKITAWISWVVLAVFISIGMIIYVPQRSAYVQNIEKIDNLTWEYQITALEYERSQLERNMYVGSALRCEKRISDLKYNQRLIEKLGEEEVARQLDEERMKEAIYLNMGEINAVGEQASYGMYYRILHELDSLGVPKKTLEMMESDMNNRISKSMDYCNGHYVFGDDFEKLNIFTAKDLWVTMDKNHMMSIFLDEPYLKNGMWYSDKERWSIVMHNWIPDIKPNQSKHYKLLDK